MKRAIAGLLLAGMIFAAPSERAAAPEPEAPEVLDEGLTVQEAVTPGWTRRQVTVHEIADKARSIGLEEDNPIIEEASRIWWEDSDETPQTPETDMPIDLSGYSEEIRTLTKMLKGEYNRTATAWDKMQAAAAVWCVLWRTEAGSKAGFRDTIVAVVTQPGQFDGYSAGNDEPEDLRAIAEDVLTRYLRYRDGATLEEVGCVLPPEYLWFCGNGRENIFRDGYSGVYHVWNWSWANPYEEG